MQHVPSCRQLGGFALGVALLAAPGLAAAQALLPSYSGIFPGTGLVTLPGMTEAQSQMAASINNVCPSINSVAPGSQLANACNLMTGTALVVQGQANPLSLPTLPGITTTAQLKDALTQLDGGAETLVPTNQPSLLRNLQGNAIASRLSVLHTRMLGGGAAENDAPSTMLALGNTAMQSDAPGGIQVAQAAPNEVSLWHDKLGVYANAIGQFGDTSTTTSQNGYDFYNAGFLAGVDYQFTPKITAGVSFGYTYADTSFDTTPQSAPGQYIHGNLFQGSLYSSWYPTDQLYIDAVGSVGGGDNTSRRVINVAPLTGVANGSFGSQTYGLALGGGYNIPVGALTLTPTARFEYRRVESDAFTETSGNGLALAYGHSGQNAVLSFFGGQVQYAISTSFGVVVPTGRFEWAHQYNTGNTALTVAYANDPTGLSRFSLLGQRPSSDYYDLGAGLALQLENNWSGFVNYDAILGVNNTSFNSFTAGFRYTF